MTVFTEPLVGWPKSVRESMGRDEAIGHQPLHYAVATYDFAKDGGAVGDIALGVFLPKDAYIPADIPSLARVLTVPTSAGAATVAVKLQSAADINAADLISGAPWSSTGAVALDGAGNILLTAKREVTITVAAADLTAGKFRIAIPYFLLLA